MRRSSHARRGARGGPTLPPLGQAWIGERLALLEEIKQRNAAALEALPKPPITVTLPDGKAIEGKAWETSPLDIASGISKGLASATCVASARRLSAHGRQREPPRSADDCLAVGPLLQAPRRDGADRRRRRRRVCWRGSRGGRVGDVGCATARLVCSSPPPSASTWASPRGGLVRPLEGDCELRLHKWDEPAGKETFWRPLSPADRAACGREARGLRRGWRCDRRHSSAHVLGEARAGPERRRGRRGLARAWPGRPGRRGGEGGAEGLHKGPPCGVPVRGTRAGSPRGGGRLSPSGRDETHWALTSMSEMPAA